MEKCYAGKIVYQADEHKVFNNINHMTLLVQSNQGGDATTKFTATYFGINATMDEALQQVRDILEIKDENIIQVEQIDAEVGISPKQPMKIDLEAMTEANNDLFELEDGIVWVSDHHMKIYETGHIIVTDILSIDQAWTVINELDIINIMESFIVPEENNNNQ